MREIKFRAWDGQKMLDSQDLTQNGMYWDWLGKQDVELMQYTGLKDSKGVEIYEDDIVKYYQPYAKRWDTHIVKYDDGWACFGLFEDGNKWCKESDWGKIKDIEIIGNIWEVSK